MRLADRNLEALEASVPFLLSADRHTGRNWRGKLERDSVEADEYLKELAADIHFNPVRARIVKSPEKHKWSSHRAYLGKIVFAWLETDFILSTFSSSDRR